VLMMFFTTFKDLAIWNTKRPFGLYGDNYGKYIPQKNDRMIVCTPGLPIRNSARNVTKSTFKHMITEFQRGYDIVSNSKNDEDIKVLFKKTDFFEKHSCYIQIECFSDTKGNLGEWAGFVESKMIAFLESLEKVPNIVPIPLAIQFPSKEAKCTWYIGITWRNDTSSEFKFVLFDFIDEMNKWDKKTDEDYLLISALKKEDLKVNF
jgi:poly(A) polymerase